MLQSEWMLWHSFASFQFFSAGAALIAEQRGKGEVNGDKFFQKPSARWASNQPSRYQSDIRKSSFPAIGETNLVPLWRTPFHRFLNWWLNLFFRSSSWWYGGLSTWLHSACVPSTHVRISFLVSSLVEVMNGELELQFFLTTVAPLICL